MDIALLHLLVVVAVGIVGPGSISLDRVLGTALPVPLTLIGTALVVLGWIVALIASAKRPGQQAAGEAR